MTYPLPTSIKLLNGATATGAGEWFRLPLNKVFEVVGITTATVVIEYRTHEGGVVRTLQSFTADDVKENNQALFECRANVTAYTSGTISAYVSVISAS